MEPDRHEQRGVPRAPSATPDDGPHDHAVSFYDHDDEIVETVARFVDEGLACGERVMLVVTEAHRLAIDAALVERGADPRLARASGRYVAFDATALLGTLLVDGGPAADRFHANVGALVAEAASTGDQVRAFGEMVALLWDQGNVTAALELETLWNDLARTQDFLLLCAYPTSALGEAGLEEVGHVCELHSEVLAPRSYSARVPLRAVEESDLHGWYRSEVFVPVHGAVAAARRFVSGVLLEWGEDEDLVDDAALVTSELATNAIRQGATPFRTCVSRIDGVLRISIEDIAPGWPLGRDATLQDVDGRGMAIVEALSLRTGCDLLPDGKAAWADLRCSS